MELLRRIESPGIHQSHEALIQVSKRQIIIIAELSWLLHEAITKIIRIANSNIGYRVGINIFSGGSTRKKKRGIGSVKFKTVMNSIGFWIACWVESLNDACTGKSQLSKPGLQLILPHIIEYAIVGTVITYL